MSDGYGYQKRQQEIARNKEALRDSFPTLAETPLLIYPRPGHVGDVELCAVIEGKHYTKSVTPEQAIEIAHKMIGLALHELKIK
jgi:plasmid stabilization system protein ParE